MAVTDMAVFTKFDPNELSRFAENGPVPTILREVNHLETYLEKNKNDHEAHFALALFLLRLKQMEKAVRHLEKAHKLKRDSQVILKTLADVMVYELQNYQKGIIYLRRLATMVDNPAQVLVARANCHINLKQAKEALEVLAKAERKNPELADIYSARSDAYQLLGDADAAAEASAKARELGSNAGRAASLARTGKGATIEEILSQLEQAKNRSDSANLHMAAAEYYDKAEEYDQAFKHYERFNQLVEGKNTLEELLAGFRNLKEAYSPSFFLSRKHLATDVDRIIFVLGMPRSGTTLTEAILAAHPQIEDRGEVGLAHGFHEVHGVFENLDESVRSMHGTFSERMSKLPDGEFRLMVNNYVQRLAMDQDGTTMLVDKMPHNFLNIGLIAMLFPKSKVIFCRRHPMDVSLSCFKQSFNEYHQSYTKDLKTLGLYYYQFWKLMEYWKKTAPIEIHDIFYEDLVQNTELVARGMIEHVGLEWDPACLDHTRTQKTVATASAWQVRQPVYTDSMMKWKKYGDNLKPLEEILAPLNKQYEEELGATSK